MIELPEKIVLCGVSGSGKSTLGEKFETHFGHQPTAFADPLKDAAKAVFGFEAEHLWGPSQARETPYEGFLFSGWCFECSVLCDIQPPGSDTKWVCPICEARYPRFVTPRLALQTLGTAWGRKLCPDIWANACFERMVPTMPYVVTDCRFRNELSAARRNRACIVLLRRGLRDSLSPHPSEAEVRQMAEDPAGFHVILDNTTGTADENFDKLVNALVGLFDEGFANLVGGRGSRPRDVDLRPFVGK